MTVGSIAVTPSIDLTAKKLDTTVVTTTEGSVHREVALIGDPVDPAALVAVMATAPVGTEYGSVVRLAGTVPLPTGSATAALQTSGNASLTSLDGKTPALGQALAAASSPVVLTAAQITTLTPPAAIVGFALEAGHLATIDGKTPALGQALAAASVPVVLTAAQLATITPLSTVAITAASLPLPANAAQETGGNLAALNAVLGTTADGVKRPDETGSLEARLLYLSEQVSELIDVQKSSQELLFRNLVALEAISRQQPYEVN